ncbi:hypothetical protein F4821DRAFT_256002 [Hypoxylon rubiginosum]|uniref:Uncharacterized protein n=1 Tax=Hypoxylon rubiginosum TaxID=110542 RepID=A0ACC0DC01_9PEZI|nr:hypothetical protein F4821DRAFT_256002 [Hypoxylon rubiginosum]
MSKSIYTQTHSTTPAEPDLAISILTFISNVMAVAIITLVMLSLCITVPTDTVEDGSPRYLPPASVPPSPPPNQRALLALVLWGVVATVHTTLKIINKVKDKIWGWREAV